MKILVVGGGGREHALIRKLRENPTVTEIYCAPGNGGIAADAVCVPVKATDIEGMVALRDMTDDFYVFDEENYAVRGREHKRTFTLGDEVRIRVTRADLQRKQLDFDLVASYDFDTKEAIRVE